MDWNVFVAALCSAERYALQQALDARKANLSGFTVDEMEMIHQNRRLEAIKSVKNRLCLSLREARDMVEKA